MTSRTVSGRKGRIEIFIYTCTKQTTVMEYQMLSIYFVIMVSFQSVITLDPYTLGSNCSFALGTECPHFPGSMCSSDGQCVCQPDFYEVYHYAGDLFLSCNRRSPYGTGCVFGERFSQPCSIGFVCTTLYAHGPSTCLCPSGQFGFSPYTKLCQNETLLRADNLRLNGPIRETELSLAWDRPLNVYGPLMYRLVVINSTERIAPIYDTNYTLTNRQPGTAYEIQIYTSAYKDLTHSDTIIETDDPLQGTFYTKPAIPGSLAANIYSNTSSVMLMFLKSEGHVDRYNVLLKANSSGQYFTQSFTSDEDQDAWRYVTFHNLEPGELYDVRIKAISWGLESEERMDSIILQPTMMGTDVYIFDNEGSSVTLTFYLMYGHVNNYLVTVYNNHDYSGQYLFSFTVYINDHPQTSTTIDNMLSGTHYEFRIKARSWNSESEEKRYSFYKPIYNEPQESESDSSYGILVGSVVGGLCLLIIVVVAIYITLKRRRRQPASSVLQQSHQLELPSMSRVQQNQAESAKIQGPCVRLDQFIQYVDQMNKQGNVPLRREFETLKVSIAPELTTNIGRLKVNTVKNRYVNAVPYDHTRVKLLAFGDGFNDYINASYIAGPRSSCDYIATQGPMFSTIPDFWRMVCEHRSGIIVMLSDFSEDGQRKLDKYWPDQLTTPVLYGEVLVEMTSCSITTTTTIRKMNVSMTGRNKLTVTHIFSPGWKNSAYTLGLDELYDVIGSVRKVAPSNEGPITVHCSSGIGRTGMFISLDTLMRIVVKTDLNVTVNVNSIVKTLLECRPHIIHSEDQYIFIHTALSAFIEKKKQILIQTTYGPKSLPSNKDERHIYASLDETAQMKQRDTHF